jgi:putative PIN family toxin of toxin-antitoxin system
VRVVLDTNIWVSGQLWRGLPWKVVRLAEVGAIEPCMTAEMLEELAEVLAYERLQPRLNELGLNPADLVAHAFELSTFFEVSTGPTIVADDPDDDVFLRCAVVADAVYVVSGDHHLLNMGHHGSISIVTVRQFLASEFPAVLA